VEKEKNYTIKGIPGDDYRELRIEAAKAGISVNKLILLIIREFVGNVRGGGIMGKKVN
jgi:predicted HicB family RNase H-like nuclease